MTAEGPATTPEPMDLNEFVDDGYLQEANRLFFHPLGLALAVTCGEDDRVIGLGPVFDSRKDPEGFVFAAECLAKKSTGRKAKRIRDEFEERAEDRIELIETVIQEVPGIGPEPDNYGGELLVHLRRVLAGVEALAASQNKPPEQLLSAAVYHTAKRVALRFAE